MPKHVVITGPESTGKSKLSLALSQHYRAPLTPEIAREYLTYIDRDYTEEDLHEMARTQLSDQLKNIAIKEPLTLSDTDLLTYVIWWEVKYGKCPPEWISKWQENLPDLYLLMDIDLPWESDPLREHPNRRIELKERYIEKLDNIDIPYQLVSGDGEERIQKAVDAINQLT